jgi:glutamate 5-kinase
MPDRLKSAKRVVIKIGSALLVDSETGRLRASWLTAICDDIAALRTRGQEVIIVSSGAIALGRRKLGLKPGRLKLDESQASAAVGQIRLAHAYQETLAPHGLTVAQLLITPADTEQRRQYINARTTLDTLLKLGVVPVINENDTVATQEIRFGDNDRLAARVAVMASADCLVLLSDIDGLYTADPNMVPDARFLTTVAEITPEIEAMAGSAKQGGVGSGGMVTKIAAAKIAVAGGCHMVITSGKPLNAISQLEKGARCTWFGAKSSPMASRKRWISGILKPAGTLVVDDGAAKALRSGNSLLPAGIVNVEGNFQRGDTVRLVDASGVGLGRGLVAYSAEDSRLIMGHKSHEIEAILGYGGRDVVIHRDDLALD